MVVLGGGGVEEHEMSSPGVGGWVGVKEARCVGAWVRGCVGAWLRGWVGVCRLQQVEVVHS